MGTCILAQCAVPICEFMWIHVEGDAWLTGTIREFPNTRTHIYIQYHSGHFQVIGFSFYNNAMYEKQGYKKGIEENLRLMDMFYPGWIMRLYFDINGENKRLLKGIKVE